MRSPAKSPPARCSSTSVPSSNAPATARCPHAIVIDRNVLEWRLDPSCEHHIAAIDSYDARIVIICNEGYQSSLAAAELRDLGLHRATDLVGGYQAWITGHLPLLDDTD